MNTKNTTMTDLTMSQFASKDDLIAAQAARIAELEAEVDAERHHHGIRNASAVRTLHALGYSWRGTDAWQPPAEQGKCLHQIAEPQPEALRLAAWLLHRGMSGIKQNDIEASNQLRWLHAESLQHQQELAAYRFTVENREARIAELEAELEAVGAGGVQRLAAAPQAAVPLFWVRLLRDGLYEGPVHNNSVGGKMLRDEKPGEWHPLYLHAATQPAAQGMEQDAARYQAIVESGNFAPSPFDNGMWGLRASSAPSTKAELDAAVDRVIAAQAKQGGE